LGDPAVVLCSSRPGPDTLAHVEAGEGMRDEERPRALLARSHPPARFRGHDRDRVVLATFDQVNFGAGDPDREPAEHGPERLA
jgi:hypothetical protein